MYNNTLYYKSGSLWKKSSDNSNFNPCTVDSAYDSIDYTNLRCVDNYTYDSGWQYDISNLIYISNRIDGETASNEWEWMWGSRSKLVYYSGMYTPDSVNYNGYTYYKGSFVKDLGCCGTGNLAYKIKRTQARVQYKSFTLF